MNKAKFLAVVAVTAVTAIATDIQVYGALQFNAAYETGSKGSVNNRLYYRTAPSEAEKGEGHYMLNVNSTRIGVNVTDNQEGNLEASGKLETDFFGGNDIRNNNGNITTSDGYVTSVGFRIRHAYGQVKFKDIGLTILMGQTSDLIGPISPAVANQGVLQAQGNLGTRRPQIRITETISVLELAAAITDDRGAGVQRYPASQYRAGLKIPAFWAGEKQNLAFGVSGHYAHQSESDKEDDQEYRYYPPSYSFNLDLVLPVVNIFTISGEFFMGKNLTSYNNGTLNLNYASSGPKGQKEGLKSLGFWAQAALKLPANFSLVGGLGSEAIDGDDPDLLLPNNPKDNLAIFTNVSYNFTPNAKLMLEYFRIKTNYAGEDVASGTLNRVETALIYGF